MLFPVFAVLLADWKPPKISPTLLANLELTCRDPLEDLSSDGVEGRPRLATPSIVGLVQDLRSELRLEGSDRAAMLDAMRVAAEKRIEGILGQSRRRHYGHAATLAACCLAIAPRDRRKATLEAFKGELEAALNSLGLSAPPPRLA